MVVRQGLAEGELLYEVSDPESGQPLAVLDLAWPEGLQPRLTQPVAILVNESPETVEAANGAGFRCFADTESFFDCIEKEVLGTPLLEAPVEKRKRGDDRPEPRPRPATFNDACRERVETHRGMTLVKIVA